MYPARWPRVRLGEVIDSTKLGLVRSSTKMGPGLPYSYIRMDSIGVDGSLSLTSLKRVHATDQEVREMALSPGDFLFNTRNSRELVGKTAVFQGDGLYLFNNNIMRIRFAKRVDPMFMMYLFHTRQVIEQLQSRKSGTTSVFAIYYKELATLELPLPLLSEQRRIVAILDKANAIRRKRDEGIRLTEELLRSTFLEMFGDPVANPKGWEINELEKIVAEDRPITYGILKPGPDIPGGVPYVRVVDIKQQRIAEGSLKRTTPAIAHEYRRSTLQGGDILVSIRGHVGRCAVVPDCLGGANITQDTARVAARFEWARSYMFWCLQIDSIQKWMAERVRGVAVKGINLGDVKKLPAPLPPKDLCLKFDRIQSTANRQHDTRISASVRSEEMFQSLVQRAFRGEL